MMHNSQVVVGGSVTFPKFTGERVYMRPFVKEQGLPKDLKRWQKTVDVMLKDVSPKRKVYIMIDQGVVQANTSHRRPGKHIDGYWLEDLSCHGGGGHGSSPLRMWDTGGGNSWKHQDFNTPEALILASSIQGCKAWTGAYEGTIGEGGECSSVDVQEMTELDLEANTVYSGNVTMLHDSVAIQFNCKRTLVRLSVPGHVLN